MAGFQVWHKHGERYVKAAEVDLANVEGAAILTAFRVDRWAEHPAIRPEPGEHRPTTFGDIVIDPEGVEFRFEMLKAGGFDCPGFTKVTAIMEQFHAEFYSAHAMDEAAGIGVDLSELVAGRIDHPGYGALAVEIRADEQAARIRDYGLEDAATHERRIMDGAEMPVTDWQPEFARMMESIANPPSFEEVLKEAASRGGNREEGKEGPKR